MNAKRSKACENAEPRVLLRKPRDPRCKSGRRDYTDLASNGLVVSGKQYDIYSSERKLESALKSLYQSDLTEGDKEDITKFINSMKARGIKTIRLGKTVYMLRDIALFIKKPWRTVTKEDIEKFLCYLEGKGYSDWTKADYKIILKRFYKWLLGEDEYYPKTVSWIKNNEPKNNILPEALITEEEILRLVDAAKFQRDKAFIYLLYESGARIGEMLTLRIKNITFGEPISAIQVTGKTGQRRIPIVKSALPLKKWLEMHPLGENPNALVWVKIPDRKGNFRKQGERDVYRELSYNGVKRLLGTAFGKAGVKKHYNPHLFRHSRATHLAKHLTEAQLKQFFGWTQASDMAARYVHLSGRDVDDAILSIYHIK